MITRRRAAEVLCAICMLVCQDNIGRIQCPHSYCFSCILQWSKVNNSCPVCRQKMTEIHKLNVQKPHTKQFKNIEPQTIIVHQNDNEEEESEWQWVVSQRELRETDFIQGLVHNRTQIFDNQEGEIGEETPLSFRIIFSNLRMTE